MKLISMTSFVLEQNKNLKIAEEIIPNYKRIVKYAEFLNQPLTLSMFVPCDENGNVLQEPQSSNPDDATNPYFIEEMRLYHEAKEKIFFKDFKILESYIENSKHTIFLENENGDFVGHKHNWEENWDIYGTTVEGMLNLTENEIELTESALKQIFGDV